ncbi:MAG: ROK family transcriptional regulator [Oscillospiraceae bacterium]|nr:ROK family transcriptional regulator [Oscillospiraceae bacterium]MBQ6465776.1 ROK family transcriptional regulator [Oscillospiraceae bacterium]
MSYKGDNLMSVKRTNRSAALRALHEKGAMSRKRLAHNMNLTPGAITKIVAEMISDGLLSEGEMLTSGNAGRREILIDINPQKACGLGVLINLQQAILSGAWLDGSVIFAESVPLQAEAPSEETAKRLCERLFALMAEHDIPRERVIGLGIAVRGITSADGRIVRNSFGALAETDYPLCELFESLTGFHCVMENNVRSLLAAQMFLSRDENEGSQFFLRCGYGIGAALSIDGRIWHGVTAQCAEIGHIPVIRRGGKPCHCGKSGCLETIASPGAIQEEARAILSPEQTPLLWQTFRDRSAQELSVFDVLTAAGNGDAGASAIVDQAIQALGSAIKALIYLVDPGKIILYGSLFEDPYYLSRLSSELQEGVDLRHAVEIGKSRYNMQLEDTAACLLAVQDFMANGGIQE